MQYEFAPMEGITGYVYRNTHNRFFGGVDRYFLPFVSPNQHHSFTTKEKKDILPKHNEGLTVVPQIMTNQAEHFLWAARELSERGYTEVNLNLGCPSGTVVSKKRGAGFLGHREALEVFLEEICSGLESLSVKLSVKTRLGMKEPEEFPALLDLFNRYPIKELILHPRVREDLYRGGPRQEWFVYALEHSKMPLSYNGNIFTAEQLKKCREQYPGTSAIMLGRGLLSNPALAREARGGEPISAKELEDFHWALYEAYLQELGEHNTLYKMKELWFYMFATVENKEPFVKRMRKIQKSEAYAELARDLFSDIQIDTTRAFVPPN